MQASTVDQQQPGLAELYRQYYIAFVELASHDLQSPLRKIEVLTEGLVGKYELVQQEEVQQYVRRIRTSTNQMRNLVEGLCELALLLPDLMELEECDCNLIMDQVLTEYSTQLRQAQAKVKILPLPMIRGDRSQLEIFFRKVLSNSLTFRDRQKAPEITVGSEEINDLDKERFNLGEDAFHKIVFADNGIGLDNTNLEKIFQPLVRLHGKAEYPGSGLGLACVKRIAENHRGFVYAESDRNEGTKINFIIPKKY